MSESAPVAVDVECRNCQGTNVTRAVWESSDGAYEDAHYRCLDCKHDWWIDGPDA